MATLQKFKLLATQCAVAGSPARSPTTSPVVHLRRRRTLRMLLNRSSTTTDRRRFGHRDDHSSVSVESPERTAVPDNKKDVKARRKLRELFVSSPPLEERESNGSRDERVDLLPVAGRVGEGLAARRGASVRPITATFRYRLLRRAWRPLLVTIPESINY